MKTTMTHPKIVLTKEPKLLLSIVSKTVYFFFFILKQQQRLSPQASNGIKDFEHLVSKS